MNKKGVALEALIFTKATSILLGAFTTLAVAAVILTPGHRERKAVEKCELTAPSIVCESLVSDMSKDEILDYIRDDDMTVGNQGVF